MIHFLMNNKPVYELLKHAQKRTGQELTRRSRDDQADYDNLGMTFEMIFQLLCDYAREYPVIDCVTKIYQELGIQGWRVWDLEWNQEDLGNLHDYLYISLMILADHGQISSEMVDDGSRMVRVFAILPTAK